MEEMQLSINVVMLFVIQRMFSRFIAVTPESLSINSIETEVANKDLLGDISLNSYSQFHVGRTSW